MPIIFKTKMTELRPLTMMASEFNNYVREALREIGMFWVKHYLPKHFDRGAPQRYHYPRHAPKYQDVKRRARMIKVRHPSTGKPTGRVVPATQPPIAFVWTGDYRKGLLSRADADWQKSIKPVATSQRQKVTIRVPLPHPIPVKWTRAFRWITSGEEDMLHRIGTEKLRSQLVTFPTVEHLTFRSGAA